MFNINKQSFIHQLLLYAAVITTAGCSDLASTVRKVTYPPDFKYVSTEELQSNMQHLGYQLQLLDSALLAENSNQSLQQQKVVAILRDIERVGTNLRANDAGSNHPFLQDYMSDFVSLVGQARIAASQNPPHYYLAGRVSGGCTSCHKVNR